MIDYKLKREINNLILCLYNPASEDPFSTDSLSNYIDDCAWQLRNGQRVKRIPFYITPALSDAKRAIADMNRSIQAARKEKLDRLGT